MWNIFENVWLLLTAAGISFVIASVVRQEKPEWGFRPLLVPLLLAAAAFGIDRFFVTDYEAVSAIVPACKKAAAAQNVQGFAPHISPNYRDSFHRSKADLIRAAESVIHRAAVEKIRTQSHVITIDGNTASSELAIAVHLDPNNQYGAGSLVFVEMEFEYEKVGEEWLIRRMEIKSVNYQPMDWSDVH